MTANDEFNLKWLFDEYSYKLKTNQHIPNTKQWKFIDYVCRAYWNSESDDYNLSDSDFRYISHIIDNFVRKMTDGEIRTFEREREEFLFKKVYENKNAADSST